MHCNVDLHSHCSPIKEEEEVEEQAGREHERKGREGKEEEGEGDRE